MGKKYLPKIFAFFMICLLILGAVALVKIGEIDKKTVNAKDAPVWYSRADKLEARAKREQDLRKKAESGDVAALDRLGIEYGDDAAYLTLGKRFSAGDVPRLNGAPDYVEAYKYFSLSKSEGAAALRADAARHLSSEKIKLGDDRAGLYRENMKCHDPAGLQDDPPLTPGVMSFDCGCEVWT